MRRGAAPLLTSRPSGPSSVPKCTSRTLIIGVVAFLAGCILTGELLYLNSGGKRPQPNAMEAIDPVEDHEAYEDKVNEEAQREQEQQHEEAVQALQQQQQQQEKMRVAPRTFTIHHGQRKLLAKVVEAMEEAGYSHVYPWYENDWALLWSYPDPHHGQDALTPERLRSNQLVNRYPAGFFTSKSSLVRLDLPSIPIAFSLPQQMSAFKKAFADHPEKVWVRKNWDHRGVMITTPTEVGLFLERAEKEIFVQEFVSPPHLIHRRKWDIGVYVVVTSLDPLRVYVYDDLLLRFCAKDFPEGEAVPSDVDTYVIADEYTSPWDADFFVDYVAKHTKVKDMLSEYFEKEEKASHFPEKFRLNCLRSIYDVVSMYATMMYEPTLHYPDGQMQFFELYRFDFVFDSELNAFLMEANMSPNLSPSAHPGLSDLFSRLTKDLVSLLGLAQGPQYRAEMVHDARLAAERELANARDWRLLRKEDVYDDPEEEPPTSPRVRGRRLGEEEE